MQDKKERNQKCCGSVFTSCDVVFTRIKNWYNIKYDITYYKRKVGRKKEADKIKHSCYLQSTWPFDL